MLRVAVVGLGRHSIECHLSAVEAAQSASLVAVCDIDADVVRRIAAEHKVRAYTDIRDLLAEEETDLLVISAPHHAYPAILAEAAQARVHVLKDKPFGRTLEESIQFVDLFASAGRAVVTYTQRRLSAVHRRAKAAIPTIGDAFWIEIRHALHVPNLGEGWRASRRLAGGGCVIDMGYHMIDLLMWYFGQPRSVHALLSASALPTAEYDVEDSAHISFSYSDQCVGTCLLSRRSPPKSENLRVIGTEGIIDLTRHRCVVRNCDGDVTDDYTDEAHANTFDELAISLHDTEWVKRITSSHLPHMAFIEACYESAAAKAPSVPRL